MNNTTTVVNLYRDKYDIYIGRAGKGQDGYFGNPFPLKSGESRGTTIEKYKQYFDNRVATDEVFKQRVLALKGKVLGCFCKPHACHGDIIAEYLNHSTEDKLVPKKNVTLLSMIDNPSNTHQSQACPNMCICM